MGETAGMLPVDIFGYPAGLPALEKVAADKGLGILDDACEALGAVDSEGVRVGRAATSLSSPFTRTSSSRLVRAG